MSHVRLEFTTVWVTGLLPCNISAIMRHVATMPHVAIVSHETMFLLYCRCYVVFLITEPNSSIDFTFHSSIL